MRYVLARYEQKKRDEAYRIYISDTLYYHAQNKTLLKRYSELLDEMNKPVDKRTGDKIALDIISKHGLKFKDE